MGYKKKLYYPKSELGQTQIAEPGQFVTGTGKPYEGPYHIANGTPVAGASKLDPAIDHGPPVPGKTGTINDADMSAKDRKALMYQVLIPATLKFTGENKIHTGRYWELTSREYEHHTPPKSHLPVVTDDDYKRGIITRYFVQKMNNPEKTIVEINLDQANKMNRTNKPGINGLLYRKLVINWSLHPTDAETHNMKTVRSNEIDFPGLQNYLINLTEFSKSGRSAIYEVQEGLYTHGAEFMLPNGKIYIGDYHIHPGKGPMVGAVHSNEYHDTLTPLAESLKNLR